MTSKERRWSLLAAAALALFGFTLNRSLSGRASAPVIQYAQAALAISFLLSLLKVYQWTDETRTEDFIGKVYSYSAAVSFGFGFYSLVMGTLLDGNGGQAARPSGVIQWLEASSTGWSAVTFVLGFITSFIATWIHERLKVPKLRLGIGPRTPDPDGRILHLRVENPCYWWRLLPHPASECTAELLFRSANGRVLAIPGRWTETPNPDPNEAYLGGRMTILPRGHGTIPVAIKFQGDAHYYAFSTRSCFGPRIDEWRLEEPRVQLRCTVRSGETAVTGEFEIWNPDATGDGFSIGNRES